MTALRTAGWYCYPWNLHDVESDLASMANSGMSHLSLAVSYHAGKFIQPRDPRRRVYFPEDGTVYFTPEPSRYGRLKPQMAAVTGGGDTLRAACSTRTLPVRAWTVLNHNSRLGFLHPDTVARNAWGDPYFYSLCPANPEVRDYAVALCSDVAESYDLDCLLLETPGWLTYEHGYHHEFAQISTDGEIGRLLGLCFCQSCADLAGQAGLDLPPLGRAVASRCDALIAGTAAGGDGGALDRDLAPMHAWRASVVTELCSRVRHEVRDEVDVRVISTCQRPHRTAFLEGGDLAALAGVVDGLELPIYQPSAAAAREDLAYVLGRVPDQRRLSAILRPGQPDMSSRDQVEETLGSLLDTGIDDVSFYNFGLLPAESIQWTTRAVAAARGKAS